MRILLTPSGTALDPAVAAALEQARHETVDATGDLTDPAFVAPLVRDVAAVVHLAPLAPGAAPAGAPGEALDAAARGTHVLMKAAVEAGVRYVVQASTLAVMDAYAGELEVTEQWRPRPQPVAAHLAPYLAELVTREFTRDPQLDRPLSAVCLRFAAMADGGEATRLTPESAARAVVGALAALERGERQRGHRWLLFHVDSPSPAARYSSAAAQRTLGYGAAQ